MGIKSDNEGGNSEWSNTTGLCVPLQCDQINNLYVTSSKSGYTPVGYQQYVWLYTQRLQGLRL